jgi:hypothetical protein
MSSVTRLPVAIRNLCTARATFADELTDSPVTEELAEKRVAVGLIVRVVRKLAPLLVTGRPRQEVAGLIWESQLPIFTVELYNHNELNGKTKPETADTLGPRIPFVMLPDLAHPRLRLPRICGRAS